MTACSTCELLHTCLSPATQKLSLELPPCTTSHTHLCAPSSTSAPTTLAASVAEEARNEVSPIALNEGVPLSSSTELAVPSVISVMESARGHCSCSSPARTHSASVSAGVKAWREGDCYCTVDCYCTWE